MEELKNILLEHAKRYPMMQPTDAVKLIYQNEFGGGHLIRDPEACLDYLRREYESVEHNPAMPLYESIGNGMVRVNLAAVKEEDLAQLGKDFIRSAAEHSGTLQRFRQKLEILAQRCQSDVFSFSAAELKEYLETYAAAGYPIVSHSPIYRTHYNPAYRVVMSPRN